MSARDLGAGWRGFWFANAEASGLGTIRVLVAVHTLWILLSRDLAGMAEVPPVFRSTVREVVRLRYLIFEGAAPLERAVQWVALVALVMAAVGLKPRIACFVAGLAIYHLAPLESIQWSADPLARGLTFAPIALLLMAFSRSGDALAARPAPGVAGGSWEYRWPVRLLQVLVVQIYFFAGLGKLLETGVHWASAENIRLWLLWSNLTPEIGVFSVPGLWIADHPGLCLAIGIGTITFELASPVALFSRRFVPFFVGFAILLHIGIFFSMNIFVGEALYLFVFVDWKDLSRLRPRLRSMTLARSGA